MPKVLSYRFPARVSREFGGLCPTPGVKPPDAFYCRLVGRDMGGRCRVTVVGVEECVERLG